MWERHILHITSPEGRPKKCDENAPCRKALYYLRKIWHWERQRCFLFIFPFCFLNHSVKVGPWQTILNTTSHQFVAVDECLCAYGNSHVWLLSFCLYFLTFHKLSLRAVKYVMFALQIWSHYLFSNISLPMRKDNILEQY